MTIRRTVKKIFGLFFLYCCIILGIFALQFRNELLYTKNFGQLKVTLRKTKSNDQNPVLKNNFQIVSKGLFIFADEGHPFVLSRPNGSRVNLKLLDYKEEAQGFSLIFDSDVNMRFSQTGSGQSAGISIQADFPRQAASIQVPYKTTGGFLITEQKPESAIFASNTGNFQLAGTSITGAEIIFTPQKNISYFSPYVPSVRFLYATAADNPGAQAGAYAESVRQFRSSFLAEISPQISTSMVERDIVAYVSEMLLLNNYQQALASVSPAFPGDSRRSFLSVPFFGNTIGLNSSLSMYFTNQMTKLQQAQTSRRLDIFETEKLALFLTLRNNAEVVKSILSIPAEQTSFQPTLLQAAGILDTYADLRRNRSGDAAILEPVLAACLDRVADSLKFDGGRLVLGDSDIEAAAVNTVKTSSALIRYGNAANRTDVAASGYLLFTSLMASGRVSGAQVYADLYPFVGTNEYYPHITALSTQGTSPVWAWTSSPEVTYTTDAEKTITIGVKFYVGDAHYMILKGIEPFGSIEMYELKYRSDRQFEMYNSSGYVYLPESKTLLLKVRNREEKEFIRLFYPEPEPEPVTVLETPAEPAVTQ